MCIRQSEFRDFSLFQNVQTLSGAEPSSFLMGDGGFYLRVKLTSPPSSSEFRNEYNISIFPCKPLFRSQIQGAHNSQLFLADFIT